MEKHRNCWWWIPTLYVAEGLPNVVVMTVAVVMYMQLGMTDTDIALYTGWLGLPWVIKPLWSPFVDLYRTKRWWVLAMQMLLGSSLAGVAFTLNTPFWFQGTMAFFFLMAFSSATHDIAADGYYMLELDDHQQVWFVGIRNTFYRLAVIFGNGVLIPVAGMLQLVFRHQKAFTWSLVFYGLAALFIAIWLYHAYIMPRSQADQAHDTNVREVAKGIGIAVRSFFLFSRSHSVRSAITGINSLTYLLHSPVKLIDKIGAELKILRYQLSIFNILLIFHLMFKTCPEIHRYGSELNFHLHHLFDICQEDRRFDNQMQASVPAVLGR